MVRTGGPGGGPMPAAASSALASPIILVKQPAAGRGRSPLGRASPLSTAPLWAGWKPATAPADRRRRHDGVWLSQSGSSRRSSSGSCEQDSCPGGSSNNDAQEDSRERLRKRLFQSLDGCAVLHSGPAADQISASIGRYHLAGNRHPDAPGTGEASASDAASHMQWRFGGGGPLQLGCLRGAQHMGCGSGAAPLLLAPLESGCWGAGHVRSLTASFEAAASGHKAGEVWSASGRLQVRLTA